MPEKISSPDPAISKTPLSHVSVAEPAYSFRYQSSKCRYCGGSSAVSGVIFPLRFGPASSLCRKSRRAPSPVAWSIRYCAELGGRLATQCRCACTLTPGRSAPVMFSDLARAIISRTVKSWRSACSRWSSAAAIQTSSATLKMILRGTSRWAGVDLILQDLLVKQVNVNGGATPTDLARRPPCDNPVSYTHLRAHETVLDLV